MLLTADLGGVREPFTSGVSMANSNSIVKDSEGHLWQVRRHVRPRSASVSIGR